MGKLSGTAVSLTPLIMSETAACHGACESMIRGKQSASLHRLVKLIFCSF